MIKYIEDKRNVRHDTHVMGVPVMLVVEDNIRYYSSFLPVIYTELITQSRELLSEGQRGASADADAGKAQDPAVARRMKTQWRR